MTDAELIARLREYREINEGSTGVSYDPIPECLAAADRIEALIAERDALFRRATLAEEWRDHDKTRADRAEAALAAPEVMHEDAPAAIIGEIGNQIHNLGCELQNDEDVSLRLSDLACRLWDAAKLFPTEPTALDRMLAETREKALREAYDSLFKHPGFIYAISGQKFKAVKLEDAAEGILALIEKPNAG